MVRVVEIFYKDGIFDADGENIKKDIIAIGINVNKVLTRKLYKFDGKISKNELKKITEELLVDPVIQGYNFFPKYKRTIRRSKNRESTKDFISVEVWFKKGVTDSIAETVKKAIKDLKIKKEVKISTGQKYLIYPTLSLDEVKKISERILSNPIIQNYEIR